jgi:hypothetical protein
MTNSTCITIITVEGGETKNFTFLKVSRRCPLVLLVKLGWEQGKALGSEGGSLGGTGLLGVLNRGNKLSIGAEF